MEQVINVDRYTYSDYLTWAEIRVELIDGIRHLMSGVSKWHTRVTIKLSRYIDQFWDLLKGEKYFVFHAPFDVILFPEEELLKSKTIVQPDLGICLKEKVKGDNVIVGAPELIIEVTSTNLDYDYRIKYDLYQKAGVKEYWIVNPKERIISAYILDDNKNKFKEVVYFELQKNSKIVSEVIEGLEIDLNKIFDFRGLE